MVETVVTVSFLFGYSNHLLMSCFCRLYLHHVKSDIWNNSQENLFLWSSKPHCYYCATIIRETFLWTLWSEQQPDNTKKNLFFFKWNSLSLLDEKYSFIHTHIYKLFLRLLKKKKKSVKINQDLTAKRHMCHNLKGDGFRIILKLYYQSNVRM